MKVDINCDLGEGENHLDCENDALLMPYITRCNIACGGHAGNELTMKLSVKNALKHNLIIGAHPGYPDRDNFGRVSINISFECIEASVLKQIFNLQKIVKELQLKLEHIKFHGALYNDIENNPQLAKKVADMIFEHYPTLCVICLADGLLMENCVKKNLNFLQEAFIDRRYLINKKLSPRAMQGSVIENQELAIEQAISLAFHKPIETIDKHWITLNAETLCLHGDNNSSLEIARKLNIALSEKKLNVQ
jgi:UPF0271 protein